MEGLMSVDETNQRMARIQHLSRLGEKAAVAGCLAVVGLYSFVLLASTSEDLLRGNFVGPTVKISSNGILTGVCYALFLAPPVVYIAGLLATRRLLALYARGQVFTEQAALELSRIGWFVVLIAPVSVVTIFVGSLMLTWANGPAQLSWNLSIGPGDVIAMVYGAMLIIVAAVMREAALMSDEHRQFV
jgi:hypothetical protein